VTRHLATTAALALAALLLVGCGSLIPTPEKIAEDTIKEGVEKTVEEATGTSVDIDPTSLPDGFPDLPTPEGELISTLAVDDTYSLSYRLDDEAAVDAVKAALLADGYEVTGEASGEFNAFVAANPEWTVSLSWYDDGEGSVVLAYGAARTPA